MTFRVLAVLGQHADDALLADRDHAACEAQH